MNRVGALYQRLHDVLASPERIPDSAFHAGTLPYQASWDEWGRGYARGERGVEAGNVPGVDSPDLLVLTVTSRESALAALAEIGEQGEAVEPFGNASDPDESSHFNRFLGIYRQLCRLAPDELAAVARPVVENPRTSRRGEEGTRITHPETLVWAHLFNLRYRMLLVDVAHAFRLMGPLGDEGPSTARGLLVHRCAGEMYNLRAISGLLVRMPAFDDDPHGPRAGPPFEMPYTLDLPDGAPDRWRLQRDLLDASRIAVGELNSFASGDGAAYLAALSLQDRVAGERIDRLIEGAAVREARAGLVS